MGGVRGVAMLAVMVATSLLSPVQAQADQWVTADTPSRQHDDATAEARRAVRQWIAQHRSRVDRPEPSGRADRSAASGQCDQPTVTDRRGDNRRLDIVSSTLTSDCNDWTITTTFAKPIDRSRLGVWWLDIDHDAATGKGCDGATYMVLTFVERGRLVGYVLHTPTCEVNDWTTWAQAAVEQPDSHTVRATFVRTSIRQGPNMRWRTGVDATGPGGTDLAPDTGWVRLVSMPRSVELQPLQISFNRFDSSATVDWGLDQTGAIRFVMTLSENSGPATRVTLTTPTSGRQILSGLSPGSTYEVTVQALLRGKVADVESARFTMPEAAS